MNYFLYRLIPPRPTFDQDMAEDESATMEQHFAYWQGLLDRGSVVVYGPVADPDGMWGLAVLEAETEGGARDIAERDPAVASGLCTFAVHPMPVTIVRP